MTQQELIKQWLSGEEAFAEECEIKEHTDVTELWRHVHFAREIFQKLAKEKPRTIVIECRGGLVQDVHGLPDGWDYDIADWDELDSVDGNDRGTSGATVKEMIAVAKKQNN